MPATMACSDELAADLDAEITGRTRTNTASRRAVLEREEFMIQMAVDTALRLEKEQRAGDWLANLEKLDTELRHREAEVAVREDEVVKRERAVMIEEETNKETAADQKTAHV